MAINLNLVGTYSTGQFDESAAEVPAFDPVSQRLFVVNAQAVTIDVLDLSDPTNPNKIGEIDASVLGGVANSVTVKDGVVAIAVEAETKTDNGQVLFFNTETDFSNPVNPINSVRVGALPDMLTFTPDGNKIIVANEAEADGNIDPQGSVSIIDVSNGVENATVTTASFIPFNGQEDQLRADGVRIFPDKIASRDLEPEYIAVSADSTKAFVTLQENNAIAVIDIQTSTVEEILPLGLKDHSLDGNGLDPSDRDDGININNFPVFGMYMPDAIASYEYQGQTYYIIANEGDDRGDADADEGGDAIRVKDLADVTSFGRNGLSLDESFDPDIADDDQLGRLNISSIDGDLDGDGDIDRLQSYGTRSFSILDSAGNIVFDSGDRLEQIVAEQFPEFFNATNDDNDSFESRSDNKGPEPEGVIVGQVGSKNYAFVGLERVGGVVVYDVTNPFEPEYIEYINNRNFVDDDGEIIPVQLDDDSTNPAAGDLGPEGFAFINQEDSPSETPLLVVANEVSGTTSIYQINETFTLQILHASDLEGGVEAIDQAANFAAIVDILEDSDTVDGSLTLSAGDNYLPGPFFNAAGDRDVFRDGGVFNDFYNQLYDTNGYNALREGGGRIDISIMNAIGFDASAIGNHEFDLGSSVFADLIQADFRSPEGVEGDRWVGANFPYLSANLDFSNDPELTDIFTNEILLNTAFLNNPQSDNAGEDVPKIAPATLIETGGETIGIVGATTQLLDSISSPGLTEVLTGGSNDMQALALLLQPVIDDILDGEDNIIGNADDVNKVVLVSHLQQIALEQELAGLLTGVDIIIAGGSDTRLGNNDDTPRTGDQFDDQYPLITTSADGNPVAIVSTDGEYSYVGQLTVDFDGNGILIASDRTPLDSLDDLDIANNGPIATTDENVEALWGNEDAFADGTKGALVRDLTEEVSTIVEEEDGNTFGFTNVFLNGNRESVRTEETNLGNLTADANLFVAQQFNDDVLVSIKNGGGIRASIGVIDPSNGNLIPPQANSASGKEEGEISQLDIVNTLRFNNELTVLTVTAQELANIIEYGVSATEDGATPGQFPQVSGIEFSFDPNATAIELDEDGNIITAGERIQNLAIVDEDDNIIDIIVKDGQVFGDSDRSIRLVTLNFLASGGDGYPFALYGEEVKELTTELANQPSGSADFAIAGSEQDALAEYLSEFFPTEDQAFDEADSDLDNRIQNLNVSQEDNVLDVLNELLEDGGVTFQSNNNGNSIDQLAYDFNPVRNIDITTNLTDDVLDLGTEADFDNLVGFYEVVDADGGIDIDGDGVADLSPDDDGYARAAITNRVNNFVIRAGNNGDSNLNTTVDEFGDVILAGGKTYSPFVLANSGSLGFEGFIEQEDNETDGVFNDAAQFFEDQVAYFAFIGANPDNTEHLQSRGNNIFGFEDLPANLGVSDNDFNDVVFGFDFNLI